MKNLFILLASFFGLTGFAQVEKFEGLWLETETGSVRIINLEKDNRVTIRNIHFDLNYDFEQTVLEVSKNKISTKSYCAETDWTVYITYTLQDDETLIASYAGDYVGVTKHKRIY